MRIDVWFDPGCPFCWNTSRWLVSLVGERDLDIGWHPFSLGLKNVGNDEVPEKYRVAGLRNLRLLRVIEGARRAGHEDRVGDLYTEFGRHIHHDDDADVDPAVVLEAVGLDAGLASAADDESLDGVIQASMDEATAIAGDDVGVPVTVYTVNGEQAGFFGPILLEVPTGDSATGLFDALVTAAGTPGFAELKRRRNGPPTAPPRP